MVEATLYCLKLYKNFIRIVMLFSSLMYLKARYHHNRNQWQLASTAYQRAIASHKKAPPVWHYFSGVALSKLRDWSQAVNFLTEAVKQKPEKINWQIRLAIALEKTQQKEQARNILESLLAEDMDVPERAITLGKLLMGFSRWEYAEKAFTKAVELDNANAEHYNLLAQSLRKQAKWWQEIEALKSAISIDQKIPDIYYRLGEACEAMSRFNEAANAYAKGISLKKSNVDAQWYYRQGYCHEQSGHDGEANPAAAKAAYALAVNKDVKLNAKRFGVGVFHQARGYWQQAAVAYFDQMHKTPWDAELIYRLGMAYDRCYEWEKAEKYYLTALSFDITQIYWHYRLGFVRERQQKYKEAAISYEYAAKNSKDHKPYWYYRLGYVLAQDGNHHQACNAYLLTRTSDLTT
jgi:CDP-glycerol glycerophosphotransferase